MTKKSHNKKRNVGIIYEQLIFAISKALVEDKPKVVEAAKSILYKYFKPGTELYKEHKLFQALIIPEIKDPSLATNILREAKKAARMHDSSRLNREKSRLIRDINFIFGQDFYRQRITEYKTCATIQVLLNDWRSGTDNLERIVIYENKVHEILLKPKNVKSLTEERDLEINTLVVRLMTEKFNKKYGNKFNDRQRSLIKQYVFSKEQPEFRTTLESIRQKTISDLGCYSASCDSDVVKAKINPVLKELREINIASVDDELLSKFMLLCQIQEELKESDNG